MLEQWSSSLVSSSSSQMMIYCFVSPSNELNDAKSFWKADRRFQQLGVQTFILKQISLWLLLVLKQSIHSTWKEVRYCFEVYTRVDWPPVCSSDLWRGWEHPVHVVTEAAVSTLWYLNHPFTSLKFDPEFSFVCHIPTCPWRCLTHTSHCKPTSHPASPTTQHTRGEAATLRRLSSHRTIQWHVVIPAKVGFSHTHGPLTLVPPCWYSTYKKKKKNPKLFPKWIFDLILKMMCQHTSCTFDTTLNTSSFWERTHLLWMVIGLMFAHGWRI